MKVCYREVIIIRSPTEIKLLLVPELQTLMYTKFIVSYVNNDILKRRLGFTNFRIVHVQRQIMSLKDYVLLQCMPN